MAQTDVVIVDQQHLVRAGFSLILQSMGNVRIAEADTAIEALELVKSCRPRVLLIAAKLGEISGIDLTRQVRALGEPQPHILIMVGSRDGDIAELAREAGADGTIGKYATPDEITDSVRDVFAA